MPDLLYPGGCLCGAVRYEARGVPRHLCFCHCVSCRRATGAAAVPWATFARAELHITRGALAHYRSSAAVLRGFCANCGSSLTYLNEAHAEDIDVAVASLDDPRALTPTMHLWVQDKLPWVSIEDGLPRHAAGEPAD